MIRTTKADRILIGLLIGLSLVGLVFLFWMGTQRNVRYASVQIDGVEEKRIPLDGSTDGKEYKFTSSYGVNVVAIHDRKVYIREADCPDQLCVHQGEISHPGVPLVCLPNRFVVEIIDQDAKNQPDSIVR